MNPGLPPLVDPDQSGLNPANSPPSHKKNSAHLPDVPGDRELGGMAGRGRVAEPDLEPQPETDPEPDPRVQCPLCSRHGSKYITCIISLFLQLGGC